MVAYLRKVVLQRSVAHAVPRLALPVLLDRAVVGFAELALRLRWRLLQRVGKLALFGGSRPAAC